MLSLISICMQALILVFRFKLPLNGTERQHEHVGFCVQSATPLRGSRRFEVQVSETRLHKDEAASLILVCLEVLECQRFSIQ
jgi:hypothetical protein